MQMLYDSDAFVVVHVVMSQPGDTLDAPEQVGFEIVDKRTNKEVFLSGDWSLAFQRQITAWQADTPEQDIVEGILDGYCQLAQLPLVVQ